MTWLSDNAVAHLRAVAELPDFSDTRYRIVREIARGGMGVVYEAEDVELQRRVAIKVLASELASEDAVERMRAEAQDDRPTRTPGNRAAARRRAAAGRAALVRDETRSRPASR